jgi:hypothetical protein
VKDRLGVSEMERGWRRKDRRGSAVEWEQGLYILHRLHRPESTRYHYDKHYCGRKRGEMVACMMDIGGDI